MEISHWFLVISKSLKIRSKYVGADPEGVIYIYGWHAQSEYSIILTLNQSGLGGTGPTFDG